MRSRRLRHVFGALAGAVAVATALVAPALAGASSAGAAPARASSAVASSAAASSAAASSAAPSVPHYDHVTVIMFTDHGFLNIAHNKYAPTFDRLGKEYGLATHYYTTSDPDAADVMAFLAGNSFGISDGLPYWDQRLDKPSLLSQLDAAHLSWKEYAQNMPYAGYLGDCYPTQCQETDTLYNQPQFNPVPDLTSVADHPAEAAKMVPASELATDARDGHMPNFSLIDANECTNMHGGPPWCQDSPNYLGQRDDNDLVSQGDAYLRQVTDEIMSGPQWKAKGNDAIVVTETEGTTSSGCCNANPGTGRVYTIVITNHGPRHLTDGTPFNHYSLLATIQHAFGLGCLQNSCDSRAVIPMTKLFGGRADGPISWSKAAGSKSPGSSPPPPVGSRPPAARAPAPTVKAAATSAWEEVPSPNQGTNDNDLWSVSGRSARDIWAVGSLLPSASSTIVHTLALHYNGKTWSRVRTANVGTQANSFYGLTTLPDGTAWATGIYTTADGHEGRALTEHWNGTKWTAVPAVNPGSADDMLYQAAAVNDHDVWAVGTYGTSDGFFHPLIEGWNGRSWKACPIVGLRHDTKGILTGVSSGADGVWAVGQVSDRQPDRQLLLHLVGHHWRVVSDAPAAHGSSAFANSVASSAAGPWVAGNERSGDTGFETLVESPAGASGRLRQLTSANPTPQDNYLQSVTPVDGGSEAWAVGDTFGATSGGTSPLIEHGSADGKWTAVATPAGLSNAGTILDGVFALNSRDVWAVGTQNGKGGMATLILHYTG